MAALALRNVVKAFGATTVVHGVSLEVGDGELVVFVGPSGCGKSTLLRMIAGLEEITSGDLLIDGARCNDVPPARRNLAMVFQSYALYPHMNVRENLAFGLENTAMPRAEIDRRVGDAARMLQIEPLLERKPKALSGGQRQRVAIGRAITRDPRIFLFDEPLSNLDAGLRVQMRVELSALHARLGATMIYVTHDQVEAMTMASRIVVLRLGRVEQVGAPLDLYNRPANQFVAEFIGSPRINLLDGRLTPVGNEIRVAVPGLADCPADVDGGGAAADEAVTLGIRPEHVVVGQGGLRATVELAEQLGSESYVHCLLPTGARLVARLPGQASLRRGEAVALDLPARHCHVFRHAEGRPALARLGP